MFVTVIGGYRASSARNKVHLCCLFNTGATYCFPFLRADIHIYFLICEVSKWSKAISRRVAARAAVYFIHWLHVLRRGGKGRRAPLAITLSVADWNSRSNGVPAADSGGHATVTLQDAKEHSHNCRSWRRGVGHRHSLEGWWQHCGRPGQDPRAPMM